MFVLGGGGRAEVLSRSSGSRDRYLHVELGVCALITCDSRCSCEHVQANRCAKYAFNTAKHIHQGGGVGERCVVV